jgi:hypothetical protein
VIDDESLVKTRTNTCLSYASAVPSGAGATGAAGATAPVAQTVRGQHGGNRLPFLPELHLEVCALTSQELEFITIFKQCLSNLCLIFNIYCKINAKSGNISVY